MATMTAEQIEQKKQLLAEKVKQIKAIYDELVEAGAIELSEDELVETGAWPLSDDDLDKAAGGGFHPFNPSDYTSVDPHKPVVPEPSDPFGRGAAEDFMKKHPELF